jgi:hypothetical protein
MRRGLPIVALLVVGIASTLPAWFAPVRWTPDGLFYQARVLALRGADEDVAVARVLAGPLVSESTIDGPQRDQLRDQEWIEHTTAITRRRVLVPGLAALATPLLGDFSLQAVSLLGYVLVAPLIYVLLRRRFTERASFVIAVGAALLPPLREWSFHPLTDSWGLALEVACLLAAVLALDRGPRWLALWVACVVALSLTRDATVVVVLAAAWVALAERTRTAAALALSGALAAVPVPVLLGAPVGGTVGAAAADVGRYWDRVAEAVRVDVTSQVFGSEHRLTAIAFALTLALSLVAVPASLARARRFALWACGVQIAVTLVAAAALATRRVEPEHQLPVGLVLIAGLALLLLESRDDPFFRLHRAGAVACVGYLALYPIASGFRLELAFVPFVAVGIARALDARVFAIRQGAIAAGAGLARPRSETV